MRKAIFAMLAVLISMPAVSAEIYSSGENSVEIYGTIRGYAGYGLGLSDAADYKVNGVSQPGYPTESSITHNMFYGLQSNSRIGVNIKINSFIAQAELGANENTLYSAEKPNTIGIRQAWGAWIFANGSRLLFGKTDTPTSMGGYSVDIYDTDGGLEGFGGSSTSNRRFQISYSISGFTFALIEDDMRQKLLSQKSDGNGGYIEDTKYTPRGAVSYDYKDDNLMAKIAATYTATNGTYIYNNETKWANLHAFGIAAAVRPENETVWLSVQLRYGVNEDLYGEADTYTNYGTFTHNVLTDKLQPYVGSDGKIYNIHRISAMAEFGVKWTKNFNTALGIGYQATMPEYDQKIVFVGADSSSLAVNSYGVYLQGQYNFSQHFAVIPQIGWYGSINSISIAEEAVDRKWTNSQGVLLIGMQLRTTF